MHRRQFNGIPLALLTTALGAGSTSAYALGIKDLTEAQASQGLKTALEKGALAAVGLLGKPDGFLGNPKVRIALPGYLDDAARLLKTFGQSRRVDELVTAMNRAAETAVPMARDLLVGAVKSMNVSDARNILTGGDTSVTTFFESKTRSDLGLRFLPVVTRATETVGLADKYNRVAGKVANLGLISKDEANIQRYITGKTLDGLFLIIGEEEQKIRRDPVGAGSAILSTVFGALR